MRVGLEADKLRDLHRFVESACGSLRLGDASWRINWDHMCVKLQVRTTGWIIVKDWKITHWCPASQIESTIAELRTFSVYLTQLEIKLNAARTE